MTRYRCRCGVAVVVGVAVAVAVGEVGVGVGAGEVPVENKAVKVKYETLYPPAGHTQQPGKERARLSCAGTGTRQ